jgi:hypothetical protein
MTAKKIDRPERRPCAASGAHRSTCTARRCQNDQKANKIILPLRARRQAADGALIAIEQPRDSALRLALIEQLERLLLLMAPQLRRPTERNARFARSLHADIDCRTRGSSGLFPFGRRGKAASNGCRAGRDSSPNRRRSPDRAAGSRSIRQAVSLPDRAQPRSRRRVQRAK